MDCNKIRSLLDQTLHPNTIKSATAQLLEIEQTEGFSFALLSQLSNSPAAILYFKNNIKKYWPDHHVISINERSQIRSAIIDKAIETASPQLSQTIAIIAQHDFPSQWDTLISSLLSKLCQDYKINIGVLQVLHSIFKRWRGQFRSEALFKEIKFVLSQFCSVFLEFFKATDVLVEANLQNNAALNQLMPAVLLLCKIYFDFVSQDLPEFFEDNNVSFMTLLHKYLVLQLESPVDDQVMEKIKTVICEIIENYAKRYEEVFPQLGQFAGSVWNLLTSTSLDQNNDLAIGFLSTVAKQPRHKDLFADPATLSQICEMVVLPNMSLRETDEETFEDDPMEYIRTDLEGSDTDTRRRAASDLVRGLVEHFAQQVTQIFGKYINQFLEQYASNPSANWKLKDTALYLVTSLSAKGVSSQAGAISVNEFVPLLPIYENNIVSELRSNTGHPMVIVGCIKFLLMFRSMLPDVQNLVPLLLQHMKNTNSAVVYTFASICIEKLFTTRGRDDKFLFVSLTNIIRFNQKQVATYAKEVIEIHFAIISKAGGMAHKVAENEYLFKTIMRVAALSREDIIPCAELVLNNTSQVLKVICSNPSNPKFNHYVFETIAVLIRFIPGKDLNFLSKFEEMLNPQFHLILQSEIAGKLQNSPYNALEFTPYVLQLMSQLLDLHVEQGIPAQYLQILPPLLQPGPWENHGNIPALVGLMESFVSKGARHISENKLVAPFLGICQKLVTSRLNDHFGFELLSVIFEHIDMKLVLGVCQSINVTNKNAKVCQGDAGFFKYDINTAEAYYDPSNSRDFQYLFVDMLRSVLIPELGEMQIAPQAQRKLCCAGMIAFFGNENVLQDHLYTALLPLFLTQISKCTQVPSAQQQNPIGDTAAIISAEDEMYLLDVEEAGYQAGFVQLAAIGKKHTDAASGVDIAFALKNFLAHVPASSFAGVDPSVRESLQLLVKF